MVGSRYKWEQSIEYVEATAALRKLDCVDVIAAAAEVVNKPLEERYMQEQYGKLVNPKQWPWLLGKNRDRRQLPGLEIGGHIDFRQKGSRRFMIAQPYHLDWGDLRLLVFICEKEGLNLSIDGTSSYFSGRTMTLLIQSEAQLEKVRSEVKHKLELMREEKGRI